MFGRQAKGWTSVVASLWDCACRESRRLRQSDPLATQRRAHMGSGVLQHAASHNGWYLISKRLALSYSLVFTATTLPQAGNYASATLRLPPEPLHPTRIVMNAD